MTPAYFDEKPAPEPPAKRSFIPRLSAKRAASHPDLRRRNSTVERKPAKIGRNKKRQASEFARTMHSVARVKFVKARPCIVANEDCRGPIENAHVTNDGTKGMGCKSGFRCVAPVCRGHHRERADSLHVIGPRAFEERFGVSLEFAAAQTASAWNAFGGTE